jgi:hypothetical protein
MSGMGSQKFSTEIRHIHQIRSADAVPDLDHLPSQIGRRCEPELQPGTITRREFHAADHVGCRNMPPLKISWHLGLISAVRVFAGRDRASVSE